MYRITVATRFALYFFLPLLITACGTGTISIRDYNSDIDFTTLHTYSWRGFNGINAVDGNAPQLDVIEQADRYLERILAEKDMQPVRKNEAEIELGLQLQLQNASSAEQAYRKKGAVVFKNTGTGVVDRESNALLHDVDPPLYTGQQRGTVILTVYDVRANRIIRQGDATVVFPDDLNSRKQMSHLEKSLRRLVNAVFK